jgi:hypothetical protein
MGFFRHRTQRVRRVCSLPRKLTALLTLTGIIGVVSPVLRAQEQEPQAHHHGPSPSEERSWSWTSDANAFFGYNYQQRKYADFSAWESQNWVMVTGNRAVRLGRLTVTGMVSLEPFTVHAAGSPQLFQTGESYQQTPLVNYQHPHDLLMALGVTYRIERPRITYVFGADLVGSPALGPTAFMHRESARDNPQAPLAHHSLDSTHITPGVLRVGVETGPLSFEGSVFRGEEPDENRLNLERPRLNSWSARVGWRRGPLQAQVSGGRLHEPEWYEPYDVTRLTASIAYLGAIGSRPLAATLAWGQNREFNGFYNTDDSYLLEWDLRASRMTTLYGRGEHLTKQILGLGLHPRGFTHPHYYSRVDALTLGAVRDLPAAGRSRLGVGADITMYRSSPELAELYQGSHSFHFFLRWRPRVSSAEHAH